MACCILLHDMAGMSIHEGKGLKMNAVGLAAKVFEAGREAAVAPMEVFVFDGFSAVYVPDSADRGLWFGYDCDWQVDVGEGDACDVEALMGFLLCLRDDKSPGVVSGLVCVTFC